MAMVDTVFTDDERHEVERAMHKAFKGRLQPGEAIAVRAAVDAERLSVTVELADGDREDVTRFEAAFALDDDAPALADARATLVEFLHAFIDEWLRDGRWPRPHLDWKVYAFSGYDVHLRGESLNEKLEAMADALLAAGDATE